MLKLNIKSRWSSMRVRYKRGCLGRHGAEEALCDSHVSLAIVFVVVTIVAPQWRPRRGMKMILVQLLLMLMQILLLIVLLMLLQLLLAVVLLL